MVRVSHDHGILAMDARTMKATVKLFADAKEDITNNMEIEGMPDGYSLDAESWVITSEGDIGILNSTGEWKWIDDNEASATRSLNLAKAQAEAKKEKQEEELAEEPIEDEDPESDMR